jgi:acetyl esterase/lipase
MVKKSTQTKKIGLVLAALAVGTGVIAAVAYRETISFYVKLLQAYIVAQRFYREYEHLARDVVFDPAKAVRLDVYSPAGGGNHPVLVFFHGGGWKDYDKKLFAPVAMRFLPRDMVVVIPDYTLYPGAGYEQMADEVAAAVAWTLEHITDYGGDPQRVVVAGHSAGGHLGGLVALDPRFLAVYGHSPDEVNGFIGMSGVYDVQAEYDYWAAQGTPPEVMTEVMGGVARFAEASPITYVRAGAPPVLVIHGEKDETVPAGIGVAFHEALLAAGARSDLRLYPESGHSDYLFAALTEEDSRIVTDVTAFVQGCEP